MALLCALALAGCSRQSASPSRVASDLPGRGHAVPEGGTLVVVQERPTTLDPLACNDVYSTTISNQISAGLLKFGANLDPTPSLARTWTITPDGLTHVFDLHPGARFHNGRPVTADDVAYSLHRVFAPGGKPNMAAHYLSALEGAEAYHAGRAASIGGIRVQGSTRIAVRLCRRDPSFLWALCLPQAAVVPREEVEGREVKVFARQPVGAGAFRFVAWDDTRVVLAANRDHFAAPPHLDTLVFLTPAKHTAEEGSRWLLEGRVHFSEVRQAYYQKVVQAENLRVLRRRELALGFVGVNCAIPPLDHPKVREALACAIDRQRLIELDSLGAVLAQGVLPPGVQCYSPSIKVLPYDPARSARALAEAGYPGGRGLPELDYWTHVRSAIRRAADSLMVGGLEAVGFRVRVHEEEWPDLSRRINEKKAALFSLSWIADLPDPDSFLGSLFASGSASNLFKYRSRPVDSLLTLARANPDPLERARLFQEVEGQVLRDVALVPLSHSASLYGVAAQVHGVDLTPLGISVFDFSHVWLEPRRHAL